MLSRLFSGTLPGIPTQLGGEEMSLLEIKELHTYFETPRGLIRAVNGVSLKLDEGKTLGLVGESGSGKTQTALSILQLFEPNQRIYAGRIIFAGREISSLPREEMYALRGNDIAMIFQEPLTSLNPVFTVGSQISEVLILHQGLTRKQARARTLEMLEAVKIPNPGEVARQYPHQLSGGMRQRVVIAMALACQPRLLIADEPTTALDVTIQAQILELMRRLQEEYKMSIMMITHNLGVVSRMCDEVVVMYLGKIVEHADVRTLFHNPAHPYTQGLLNSIPKLGGRRSRLEPIKGVVPDPRAIPEGCSFRERCPVAMDICAQEPPVIDLDNKHSVRCWRFASQSMAERDAQ